MTPDQIETALSSLDSIARSFQSLALTVGIVGIFLLLRWWNGK